MVDIFCVFDTLVLFTLNLKKKIMLSAHTNCERLANVVYNL